MLAAVGLGLVATGLTPTRWAPLVGGVLVGLGAVAVVLRARHWPAAPIPVRRTRRAPGRRRRRDAWDALDRGEDPTA